MGELGIEGEFAVIVGLEEVLAEGNAGMDGGEVSYFAGHGEAPGECVSRKCNPVSVDEVFELGVGLLRFLLLRAASRLGGQGCGWVAGRNLVGVLPAMSPVGWIGCLSWEWA